MTKIHGWGRYPIANARVLLPKKTNEILINTETSFIPRGQGRSYGDSANADIVLQTDFINRISEVDEKKGVITIDAGVLIRDLLATIVPHGWFLPVTPGSSWVTIGGAIASDVHGKNHHQAGTFGEYIESMQVMLGTGEIVRTSHNELSDLFHATCGGMGLTGIILNATIKLKKIKTSAMLQETKKTCTVEEACNLLSLNSELSYCAAWVDLINKRTNYGRSVLIQGEHADDEPTQLFANKKINIPYLAPHFLINRHTGAAFNFLYYLKSRNLKNRIVSINDFFYPLDKVGNWNRLYGQPGFIQYQFAIPETDAIMQINRIKKLVQDSQSKPLLVVLKNLGAANQNILSFPIRGYTFALDFKINQATLELTRKLNDVIIEAGGKIYLAKDALMSKKTFRQCYPNWERFEEIREKYGAIGVFQSHQSRRLGLA